jgi:hypothetical protein
MKTIIKQLKEVDYLLSVYRENTAGLSGFQSKLRELIFEAEQLQGDSFIPRIFEGNIERNQHQIWVEQPDGRFVSNIVENALSLEQILYDVKYHYLKEIKN